MLPEFAAADTNAIAADQRTFAHSQPLVCASCAYSKTNMTLNAFVKHLIVIIIIISGCFSSSSIITDKQLKQRNITRIYILGDIHGSLNSLLNAAYLKEICDTVGNWIAHDIILIQVGDLIHRGQNSIGVVRQFMKWQQQAPNFNSEVIVLRGNHEEAEIRFYHPDYAPYHADSANDLSFQFPDDIRIAAEFPGIISSRELLLESTELGQWIRNLPVVQIIGNSLFVHGGLDRDTLKPFKTLENLNSFAKTHWKTGEFFIRDEEFFAQQTALDEILNTRRFQEGSAEFNDSLLSIWLILDHLMDMYSKEQLILQHMVVGHSMTKSGTAEWFYDEEKRVALVMVDSGYYQGKWSISYIDVDDTSNSVYTYDHTMIPIEVEDEINRERIRILRKDPGLSLWRTMKRDRGTKRKQQKVRIEPQLDVFEKAEFAQPNIKFRRIQ